MTKTPVYRYGDTSQTITILAGTHGNESAPTRYLLDYLPHIVAPPANLVVVPCVNPVATLFGVRSMPWQADINRCWPNKHRITRELTHIIQNSNLVIDFHEAWDWQDRTPGSLGQVLYTNSEAWRPRIELLAKKLARRFVQLHALPPLPGTLDSYCTDIGVPYILVELAGQNNIVPLSERMEQMQIILYELAGLQ